MTRRVLIVQRRLPEYRVPFFERLKVLLEANDVHLALAHGAPTAQERTRRDEGMLPWATQVRNRYVPLSRTPVVFQELPRPVLDRQSLVVLSHENGNIANFGILSRLRNRAAKVAFWGHGPTQGSRLRDRLKRWSARRVDWWFAYTSVSVDRVVRAGFAPDRITCVENATDTRRLQEWTASVSEPERLSLRRALGIDGEHVAVTLGSLTPEKRLPFLLQAADLIRRRVPDFHLILIGDGPQRAFMDGAARSRPWLHVVGARHDREKACHCALGRINLNPGMVGLGIVDSFAMSLPLLTTRADIHSPEIAYLEHGRNALWTEDRPAAFADLATDVLMHETTLHTLAEGCRKSAQRYTIENMAERYADGVLRALEPIRPRPRTRADLPRPMVRKTVPRVRVAVVWRRFLPYHEARVAAARRALDANGMALQAIEVASNDVTYGFPASEQVERICCFPGSVYQHLRARVVFRRVLDTLNSTHPDVVFAPATPFPEGMAAIAYRNATDARVFIMDDAWDGTDARGALVHTVKRLLHRNIDGAFVPALLHRPHYEKLGVPRERIVLGLDVVDNDHFAQAAARAQATPEAWRDRLGLPGRYLLFVGRFLPCKGLDTLIAAFARYRATAPAPLHLVLVGASAESLPVVGPLPEGLHVLGPRFGDELGALYGLADALVAPSLSDTWGLVVNEAMAAGLPVVVSRGCGAAALVESDRNGWTFARGHAAELAALLRTISDLTPERRAALGRCARQTIAAWGPDRFAAGMLEALELPRALPAPALPRLATRLWHGWVRTY